jgi:hypothetical protein
MRKFAETGSGYIHIQSTRPQTLGYGLTDSPAGLLAWIYEKLVNSRDPKRYFWTDDEGKHARHQNVFNGDRLFHSLDLGFHLLVLPCWPGSISANIL